MISDVGGNENVKCWRETLICAAVFYALCTIEEIQCTSYYLFSITKEKKMWNTKHVIYYYSYDNKYDIIFIFWGIKI